MDEKAGRALIHNRLAQRRSYFFRRRIKRKITMIDLGEVQREIYANKVQRNWNVTDVGKEIVLMVEELGELARAYKNSNKLPADQIDQREEIIDAVGDLMVYCLGLSEMMGVNAEEVLTAIVENNKKRSHTGWM